MHWLVTAALLLLAPPRSHGVHATAAGSPVGRQRRRRPERRRVLRPPPAPGRRAAQAGWGTGGLGWGGRGATAARDEALEPPIIGCSGPRDLRGPAAGGGYTSLWSRAEPPRRYWRYREIFELNAGRPQPDGSKLTIASLIRPGWILRMPRDAHGPGIRVVTLHEQAHGPGGDMRAGHGTASGHGTAVGTGDGRAAGASGSPAVYPYELAAALLAAGVLSALGRRRREQLWHRAFGRQVAVPVQPRPHPRRRGGAAASAWPSARMIFSSHTPLSPGAGRAGRGCQRSSPRMSAAQPGSVGGAPGRGRPRPGGRGRWAVWRRPSPWHRARSRPGHRGPCPYRAGLTTVRHRAGAGVWSPRT